MSMFSLVRSYLPFRVAPAARTPHELVPGARVILSGDPLRLELQAICEHVFDISPISWSDDLLGLGVDSLTLLNLLLEIEKYTGYSVPLSVFLSAPSIEGLAVVLQDAPP